MPRITRSALVPFSAEQMYALVNDVESYPSFVPGCAATRVLSRDENSMTAALDVSKAGIRKTFVTRNRLTDASSIDMELVEGPFRQLSGGWKFISIDVDACQIELNLEFEFTNFLVEKAFGTVFNELAINMVKAFSQRAKDVYAR